MAFTVYLGILAKRENSTEKLGTASMTPFDCVLLRGSGMLNPKIEFEFAITSDPSQWNVAYIPSFGRYYWIREWEFNDRLWTAYMEVDVLATYKSKIGDTSLYVLRAANAYDGDIVDNYYPVKTGCSFSNVTKSNQWVSTSSGFFVLGIVSRHGQYGSITYYALTASSMSTLVTQLIRTTITNGNGFNWDDCSQALQKALVDPMQYIRSCVFIPRPISDISGTTVNTLPIFDWDVAATAMIPNSSEDVITLSYTIPQHPDSASRGNYVNSAPYTVLTLQAQPFGVIEIDTSVTANSANLQVDIHLDIFTGMAVMEIICNNEILNSIEAQVGVPVQISQVSRDYLGGAMSALGAVGAGIGKDFMGAANGIGNAINAMVPRSNTIGSSGSFTALHSSAPFQLTAQFFRPVTDDLAHNGRPLCAKRKPNTVGGYMLIQDGDVSISGTKEEGQMIKEYLETGFYYE